MIILVTREPKILSSAEFAPLIGAEHDQQRRGESRCRAREWSEAIAFTPSSLYPGSANLMAKMIARITTAGFASVNFPAMSLASA